MLEIEMKFAVAEFDAIRARLLSWPAHGEEPIDEADHYFNAPDRDFAGTGEAFRLRRIGPRNCLTYKGPRLPGLAKTRPEIEVAIGDGDHAAEGMIRLLSHLGYRPVEVVRKRRSIYRIARQGFALEICLDEVAKLGHFVEVEIMAPPEQRAAAEAVLKATADELGLDTLERRSYLTMILAAGLG